MEDSYLGIYIMNQGPITAATHVKLLKYQHAPSLSSPTCRIALEMLKSCGIISLELLQHCLLTFSVAASSIGGHLLLKDIVFYKQFSQ